MIAWILALAVTAHASPDKIGNGGGIWTCWASPGEIQASVLVDFFEAENEFGWKLIQPTRDDPMQIVSDIAASAQARFPDYAPGWNRVLQDVLSRKHLFNGKLEKIEDSLYRGSPPPSLCHNRDWDYVQFANYNDRLNLVQIRQDFWNSNRVSALDKAGLIWHEVIYRWMREEFSEENSVRARQINGVIFSTMASAEARAALENILKQGSLEPRPDQPVYVCLIRNGVSTRYFLDYGINQLSARNRTARTCQTASEHLSFHCDEGGMRCDSFTSMKQKYTCGVTHGVEHKTFTQTGRSPLEAEAKARRACSDAYPNSSGIHCGEPTCE